MKTYAVLLALLAAGWAGCSRPAGPAGGAAAEKGYPLQGEVVSVDVTQRIAVVQHQEIAGLMPAMTMEFAVSEGDARALRAGEKIRATLFPATAGPYRLGQIWPDDVASTQAVNAGARVLREDTHDRGKAVYREVGEKAPEFVLYNQDGQVVDAAHFRGQQIMLNFIYTRCPVANMCPAATMKMMEAQKLARQAGVSDIQFLSVTLDPTYDTPGVLKEYAVARGIDTGNFSFLTGPEHAIQDLLLQFGVIAEFDGGILKHSLTTLLIDPAGRIIDRADGSAWEAAEFVKKMRHP